MRILIFMVFFASTLIPESQAQNVTFCATCSGGAPDLTGSRGNPSQANLGLGSQRFGSSTQSPVQSQTPSVLSTQTQLDPQRVANYEITPFLGYARNLQPKQRFGMASRSFDGQSVTTQNEPQLIFPRMTDFSQPIDESLFQSDLNIDLNFDNGQGQSRVQPVVRPQAIFISTPIKRIVDQQIPLQRYYEEYQVSPGFSIPTLQVNSQSAR